MSPVEKIFTNDERIELSVRAQVRSEFSTLMPEADEDLEKVLFEMVYPPFGSRSPSVRQNQRPTADWNCVVQ